MDSSQRICRFCYNTYDEKDISVIRETEKNLLRVLYVPLDLTITDCPVICTTCKEQLKDCDSFKKLCISTENCIKPYLEDNVKINLSSIYNCLNSEKNDKHICRLCMQPTDDQTVLNEKETAQFSVFFPEINLHITSSVVFCTKCYGSLQKHLKFTKTCLDWEIKLVKMKDFLGQDQKMSLENFLHSLKYHDMVKEEKVDTFTEQLHLNNIKKEIDEDMEEMLKREEENIIAHQKQLFIKQEHIPIKSETPEDANEEMNIPEENYAEDEEMDEKFMLSNSELEIKDESTLEEARKRKSQETRKVQLIHCIGTDVTEECSDEFSGTRHYQCDKCHFSCKRKDILKRHIMYRHTDPSNVPIYKCKECGYEGKSKYSLQRHILLKHTDSSKVYKCKECRYTTIRKNDFEKHVKNRHSDSSDIQLHECSTCNQKFRYRVLLERHTASNHGDVIIVKEYKCEECNFVFGDKSNLRRHILSKHAAASELHKCEQCDYRSSRKSRLNEHVLVHHSDRLDVELYRCDKCNFQYHHKSSLNKHLRAKHASEIKKYKCEICNFESVHRASLKRHIVSLHTDSETYK